MSSCFLYHEDEPSGDMQESLFASTNINFGYSTIYSRNFEIITQKWALGEKNGRLLKILKTSQEGKDQLSWVILPKHPRKSKVKTRKNCQTATEKRRQKKPLLTDKQRQARLHFYVSTENLQQKNVKMFCFRTSSWVPFELPNSSMGFTIAELKLAL